MIISDEHRLIFIHIPKCAGTSARLALAAFDTSGGAFSGGLAALDRIGEVDTAHIPLAVLQDHFPEVFVKVETYQAFAILRDPFKRFPASLYQRMQMYGRVDLAALARDDLRVAALEVIEVLKKHEQDAVLPPDFIHFQPQATYVELKGKRIVKSLFDIGNLGAFFEAVNQQLGGGLKDVSTLETKKANVSRVYRSPRMSSIVSRIPAGLRYRLLARIPSNLKNRLRSAAYESGNTRLTDLMQDPEIARFVEAFYARDIALLSEVRRASVAEERT